MATTPMNQPATSQPVDAYDDAMNPTPVSLERTYFGEVTTVDVWHCILEKGVGKRKFDEMRDDPGQKRTAITLQLQCEKKDGGYYPVDQDTIHTAKEWTGFTLPSLRKLTLDLRSLRGRFVKFSRKPTGETYVNKTSGETKDRTAIVFEEVFADRDAMKAAAEAFYGSRQSNGPNGQHAPVQTQPVNGASPADQQERQFALDSLPILWQAAGKQKAPFLAMVTANPMISKYFAPDSQEVLDIIEPLPF